MKLVSDPNNLEWVSRPKLVFLLIRATTPAAKLPELFQDL